MSMVSKIEELCKKENIHTCIDTAGSIPDCKEVFEYTDLVMFDIKGTNKNNYKEMDKFNIKLNFLI